MTRGQVGNAVLEQVSHQRGVKFLGIWISWADVTSPPANAPAGSVSSAVSRLIIYEGTPPAPPPVSPFPFTQDYTTDFSSIGNIIFDTIIAPAFGTTEFRFKDYTKFGRIMGSPGANVCVLAVLPTLVGTTGTGLWQGSLQTQWVARSAWDDRYEADGAQ